MPPSAKKKTPARSKATAGKGPATPSASGRKKVTTVSGKRLSTGGTVGKRPRRSSGIERGSLILLSNPSTRVFFPSEFGRKNKM